MSWDNGTAFQLVLGQKQDGWEYHIDSNEKSLKQTQTATAIPVERETGDTLVLEIEQKQMNKY